MTRQQAEQIAQAFLKPVYGFALKRCRNLQDAQDVSQEIILKAYRALLMREDIADYERFIWTIAHHEISNYYRKNGKNHTVVSLEGMGDILPFPDADVEKDYSEKETEAKLRSEIARLSAVQRRVVIGCYYENKKLDDIARELSMPVGTVKWHLFEAKKELKRGIQTVRSTTELTCNPIRFSFCGGVGTMGSQGGISRFFRSALSQNIVYAVLREPMTVNEIADALGVSPVYVENETEYLYEYGFLTRQKDRYLCNLLLSEPTSELYRLQDEMYEKAAEIFAGELADTLLSSDIWSNPHLAGGYTEELSFSESAPKDKNFFLWALIPYIAANSGKQQLHLSVPFESASSIRPDGGRNIGYAAVIHAGTTPPKYTDSMRLWHGPFTWQTRNLNLWQADSEWSEQRISDSRQWEKIVSLLEQELSGNSLSQEEYAELASLGVIKTIGQPDKLFKAACQYVWVEGKDMRDTLLAMGDTIKEKHAGELRSIQREYIQRVMQETPRQLRVMQEYLLQFLFYSDGWFILHCLKKLVQNGRLQPPKEHQKKALTSLIFHD